MRRKTLFTAILLPTTYAFSLSNFQLLPFPAIPKDCQDVYNSDIPYCTQTDFTEFCSTRCITGLYAIAEQVSRACEGVSVSASTLLGMVLGGEMVNILCPQPKLKPSRTSSTTILLGSTSFDSTKSAGDTSTQSSNPTTLYLTASTSQTSISEPKKTTPHVTTPHSTTSDTTSPTSQPAVTTTPKATMITPSEGVTTSKTSSSIQTSSRGQADDNDNDDDDSSNDESGGGSPFDNQNFQSGATSSDKTSFCAMAIALIWACFLQR